MANDDNGRKLTTGAKTTWYVEELSAVMDSDADDKLPGNRKGRFVCTSQRNQFFLAFDNGDVMLV